jgi:hypothetical protein
MCLITAVNTEVIFCHNSTSPGVFYGFQNRYSPGLSDLLTKTFRDQDWRCWGMQLVSWFSVGKEQPFYPHTWRRFQALLHLNRKKIVINPAGFFLGKLPVFLLDTACTGGLIPATLH